MARDRKRAKQRQRKRSGQQQKQRPQQREPRPAHVPESEPDDALKPDEEALEPVEPLEPLEPIEPDEPDESAEAIQQLDPRDPLGQAAPDAELAELAEAGLQEPGAPVGRPLDEKDYPHLDELEGADVIEESEEEEAEAAADKAAGRPRRRAAAGRELPREGNRFINFLRACVAELRRVQWPNRRQVGQATAVVLAFVVVAGTYLGLLDAAFSRVINAIL